MAKRVYARVDEIDRPVDIVDEAVKIKAKVLWLQLGVISDEGAKIARDGGL